MSKINISNNSGDVNGVNISGTGNIIGKNINVSGNIKIDQRDMKNVPEIYSRSIVVFADLLNNQLKDKNIPIDKTEEIEKQLNQILSEIKDIDDKKIDEQKKGKIRTFFEKMMKGILKVLPASAETFSSFTPLAPFSKLIGKSIEEIIKSIQEKE